MKLECMRGLLLNARRVLGTTMADEEDFTKMPIKERMVHKVAIISSINSH